MTRASPSTSSLRVSGSRVTGFNMKLTNVQQEYYGIPETDFDAVVRMPSAEFMRICRDLSIVGDDVEISVTREEVKFSTRRSRGCRGGGKNGVSTRGGVENAFVVWRENNDVDDGDVATVIDVNEEVSLTVPIRYLNSFAKATTLSPVVILSIARELPLVVEYRIAEMGYLRFYLAPKTSDCPDEASYTNAEASRIYRNFSSRLARHANGRTS